MTKFGKRGEKKQMLGYFERKTGKFYTRRCKHGFEMEGLKENVHLF